MRWMIGLVLAGLGAFLVMLALLLSTYVSSEIIKFPLNAYETVTLTASGVSYFSPVRLTELNGVRLRATYTISGDGLAGSSSTAVWDEFGYVYDETNKLPVQFMTRTFAFNRHTAELVACCGASIDGNTAINQAGLAGYVFPIGTLRTTYEVFDATLDQPEPFVYSGTAAVRGIQSYEFTENVAPTWFSTQTVPGSAVGMAAPAVTLPEYYQMHLVYYVDPQTGALLDISENETLTLDSSPGVPVLLFLAADLKATSASVNGAVALDRSGRVKIALIDTTLPLTGGLSGLVLLAAGVQLARKPRQEASAGPAVAAPQPVVAAQEDSDPAAQPGRHP